jgi:hypothetical protein
LCVLARVWLCDAEECLRACVMYMPRLRACALCSVADEFWILDDEVRRLRRFDGQLSDYKKMLLRASTLGK